MATIEKFWDKVVWAHRPEYAGFFPALVIDKNWIEHRWWQDLIKSSLYGQFPPKTGTWPKIILCSSCGWPLGSNVIFYCKLHRLMFCVTCFDRLKFSLKTKFRPVSRLAPHDPSNRTIASRQALRELVNAPISSSHLENFEILEPSQFSKFKLKSNGGKNRENGPLCLEIDQARSEIEDFFKNLGENENLVFWLDNSGKTERLAEKKFLPFEEHFASLSSRDGQRDMSKEHFNELKRAVGTTLRFLGKSDVRCQSAPIHSNYEDCYDNTCYFCAEVGDLICCDRCTRVFHFECVGLEKIPEGDWCCDYCETLPILLGIAMDEADLIKNRFGRAIRVEAPPSLRKEAQKRYSLRSRAQRKTPSPVPLGSSGDETDDSSESSETAYDADRERGPGERASPAVGEDFVRFSFLLENAKKSKKRECLLLDEVGKEEFGRVCKLYEDLLGKQRISTNPSLLRPKYVVEKMDKSTFENVKNAKTSSAQLSLPKPKLYKKMSLLSQNLAIENSAVNFLMNSEFPLDFGYLVKIPKNCRVPKINEKTGLGGYADAFLAINIYRPNFAIQDKNWHIWAIDKIPVKSVKSFLAAQKRVLAEKREFFAELERYSARNAISAGNESEGGFIKDEGNRKTVTVGGKIIKVPPPPPQTKGVGSVGGKGLFERCFQRKPGFPRKRNRNKSLIKLTESLEKDNTLFETIISSFSKEKYGNSMKLKAVSLKERDMARRLNELKQRVNRRNVEICENLKQISFYGKKSKELVKRMRDDADIKDLIDTFAQETSPPEQSQPPNLPPDALAEPIQIAALTPKKTDFAETSVCPLHRARLKNCRDDSVKRRLLRVDRVAGWKFDRGQFYALVSLAAPSGSSAQFWTKVDKEIAGEHRNCFL